MYILWVVGTQNFQDAEFGILSPALRGSTQKLAWLLSAIPYTAFCSCRRAASEQCRYVGFFVGENLSKEHAARKFPTSVIIQHPGP